MDINKSKKRTKYNRKRKHSIKKINKIGKMKGGGWGTFMKTGATTIKSNIKSGLRGTAGKAAASLEKSKSQVKYWENRAEKLKKTAKKYDGSKGIRSSMRRASLARKLAKANRRIEQRAQKRDMMQSITNSTKALRSREKAVWGSSLFKPRKAEREVLRGQREQVKAVQSEINKYTSSKEYRKLLKKKLAGNTTAKDAIDKKMNELKGKITKQSENVTDKMKALKDLRNTRSKLKGTFYTTGTSAQMRRMLKDRKMAIAKGDIKALDNVKKITADAKRMQELKKSTTFADAEKLQEIKHRIGKPSSFTRMGRAKQKENHATMGTYSAKRDANASIEVQPTTTPNPIYNTRKNMTSTATQQPIVEQTRKESLV